MGTSSKAIEELRKLPVEERLQLVEQLWDSIAEDSPDAAFPITPELADELDRRLEEHEADPGAALPWEVVQQRIRRIRDGNAG
jgi:putative addiction module component (TIGR02574 family)